MVKNCQMLPNHESQLKTNTWLVLKPQMDTRKIDREGDLSSAFTSSSPKTPSYEITIIFLIFTNSSGSN